MEHARQPARGLLLAVGAALAFGVGGPFAKSLLEAGWSSNAVVLARCLGVLAALLAPAILSLRGRWGVLRRNAGVVVAYGGFAVVGAQLFFYTAIRYMPVGAALLIEYLAPVLLVGIAWARTRRRPGALVLAGSAAAIAGLLLVVDLGGDRTQPIGPVLALVAAFGLVAYFLISARVDPELPTVALLAASMLVGSVVLLLIAAVGLGPLDTAFADVRLLGRPAPWWQPLAVVVGVSTLLAYLLGLASSSRLGSRVASFTGLLEVVFAVIASWVLLGDLPAPVQLVGGVLILAGVVLVKAQGADRTGQVEHAIPRRRVRSRAMPGGRSARTREGVRARP